ncbi:MAG TPA: tyrosine-type recombinase/integrase [Chitinophagales bacterium]|nr:tyrosine-type recombinase/integrase [Chitinophagales bacterium]
MNAQIQSFLNFMQYEKRSSPHTLESYTNDLLQFTAFLKDYEKEVPQASHIDIRNWMVSMMEQKITPRTINRKVSALQSFYKFLMRKGELKKNPLAKVQTPKTSKRLPVFVEQPGIEKLLGQIEFPEGYEGARDRITIELLYGTGMRRSELMNLKETDFDSYNSQIKVLGKGNKERIIPVHNRLTTTIKEFIEIKRQAVAGQEGSYLIVSPKGKKLDAPTVYKVVKKYLDLVTTVDKRSPHTLRHTFATHLMNNGADINAVKELLGHASLAATQVYTHNTIDKLKNIYKQAHPKA